MNCSLRPEPRLKLASPRHHAQPLQEVLVPLAEYQAQRRGLRFLDPVPLAHRCIADQGRPQVRGVGVAAADGGTELLGSSIH